MENKNNKNTKKIVIIAIAALVAIAVIVAVIFAVSSGNNAPDADDTAIDDTGAEISQSEKNEDPDGPVSEKDPDDLPETDENGDTVESNDNTDDPDVSTDPADSTGGVDTPGVDTPGVDTGGVDTPGVDTGGITLPGINIDPDDTDDPNVDPDDTADEEPDDDEPLESTVVVDPGKTGSDWPVSLPSAIPAFKGDLVFSNNCSYEKYDEQEIWYMSWDTTAAAYDAWMTELANAGFVAVPDVYGFYANGEYILDITTEQETVVENEEELVQSQDIWVSMDVYHALDIVYPAELEGVIPSFDLEATFEYWHLDAKKRTMTFYYQTPYEWAEDIATVSSALSAAGFSVSDGQATKKVDGNTVTVSWSASNTNLVITY